MEDKAAPAPPGVDPAGKTGGHPLENPVVLERLFDLIPFELKDFQSFRLVSRAWSQCSLSTWRQNAWLALHDRKITPEKNEDDDDSDDREDSDWVDDDDDDAEWEDDEDVDLQDDEENVDLKDDDDVVDSYDDKDVHSDDEVYPWMTRQNYLKQLENDRLQLSQHPFRKYAVRGWGIDLKSTNKDGEQDQVHFWNKVGPLMTHLDLAFCDFAGVADFRTVIFKATPNLQSLGLLENTYTDKRPATVRQRADFKLPEHAMIPPDQVQNNLVELNVELLSLGGESDSDEEDEFVEEDSWVEYLPITWIELFIHFPNIKKLGRLELAVDQVEGELIEFFISLEILREEHGPRYLANLCDLDIYFPERLVCQITELRFPLKRLTVFIRSTMDEHSFMHLLQYPLEYLNVDRSSSVTRPFQNFPFGLKFNALKELIFTGGPIAPNLMFLKECPNLELLRYTPFSENWLEADLAQLLSDGSSTKLEKLKDLSIINDGCSAAEIKLLGVIMPNVRNLEVGLDDGSFRAVCEVWKELKHLSVVPFRVGKEALLGKDERSVEEKFRHPNLTDLKSLKKFEMEDIKSKRDRQGLTDVVILDGILALPNLEVVDLCLSSKVTPAVRTQLEMKFPKCHISTQEEAAEVNDKSE